MAAAHFETCILALKGVMFPLVSLSALVSRAKLDSMKDR